MTFAIGLYISTSGVSPIGQYDPTQSSYTQPQFAGTWSTAPTLTWYAVPQPRGVTPTPPPMIGADLSGVPVVRGWEMMEWDYPYVRPASWLALANLYRASRRPNGAFTGLVWIQWDDPVSGATSSASARWASISSIQADMPTFKQIRLIFSHLGATSGPATGLYVDPVVA